MMLQTDLLTAMKNEHRIVKELTSKLEEQIAVASTRGQTGEWLDGLRFHFGRYRTHLKGQFAMEESGGFMQPVLDQRPTLSPDVDELKREHVELLRILDLIHEEIHDLKPGSLLLIEDVCLRIQHVITAMRHHERREELLVTFVFSQDIGSKG